MADTERTRETDVVVIGGGLAGHCAALEAAQAGARVLLLEKQPAAGGSTVLSDGFFAFAGTDLQQAAGVEDSNARLLEDLRRAGGEQNDERLLAVYADHQLEAYAWLKKSAWRSSRYSSVQRSRCRARIRSIRKR